MTLALAACSSGSSHGANEAGSPVGAVDAATPGDDGAETTDASGSIEAGAAGTDASDARGAEDGPARTIPPTMPGTWRDLTPPSLAATVGSTTPCTDIQYDPSNRSTLYAMYGAAGVWKSTDAGATWAAIGDLPMPASLGRLRVDPADPTHLYATGSVQGSSLGFWVSHDGGQTFSIPPAFAAGASGSSPAWSNDVYNIAVDPTDFEHFILSFHQPWPCCGEDAGILESTDGGQSFVPHAPAAGMNHGNGIAFLYDPDLGLGSASTWLVGGGYAAGLYRTADAGKTWAAVSTLQDDHGELPTPTTPPRATSMSARPPGSTAAPTTVSPGRASPRVRWRTTRTASSGMASASTRPRRSWGSPSTCRRTCRPRAARPRGRAGRR